MTQDLVPVVVDDKTSPSEVGLPKSGSPGSIHDRTPAIVDDKTYPSVEGFPKLVSDVIHERVPSV